MVRAGKVGVYKNLISQLAKIKGNITEIRIIGVSILLHASKSNLKKNKIKMCKYL